MHVGKRDYQSASFSPQRGCVKSRRTPSYLPIGQAPGTVNKRREKTFMQGELTGNIVGLAPVRIKHNRSCAFVGQFT
jgi:hypothetical protein